MLSKIIFIFILGICVLIAALLLNLIAGKFNISTWYDFVRDPGNTNALSYIWLFVVYPFCLGLAAYLISKFINIS